MTDTSTPTGNTTGAPDFQLFRHDPLLFARKVLQFHPDPIQAQVLDPDASQTLLCCSRGWGKTETIAVLAAWHLATRPDTVCLVVSETAEKAAELVLRTLRKLEAAGLPMRPDPLRKNGFQTPEGARILPVPSRDGAVRGYPATLIVVDEAAKVPDKVWTALNGTRASTSHRCTVWIMSTPGPRRGFFYELWTSNHPGWRKIHVPATLCPRIRPDFLDQMRQTLSPDDFDREFLAIYGSHQSGGFWSEEQLNAVTRHDVPVLDTHTQYALVPNGFLGGNRIILAEGGEAPARGFYIGVDLGQARDHATLAVIEYKVHPLGGQDPVTWRPYYDSNYRLRWLHRFPTDTLYTDVAETIQHLVQHSELQHGTIIIVDAGGPGRPFLDHLRSLKSGARLQGVQITGGQNITRDKHLVNIPKQQLVYALDLLLRKEKLLIAGQLPLYREFRQELLNFQRVALPTGKWTYTGKAHGTDDLVLATALALGYALHLHRPRTLEI